MCDVTLAILNSLGLNNHIRRFVRLNLTIIKTSFAHVAVVFPTHTPAYHDEILERLRRESLQILQHNDDGRSEGLHSPPLPGRAGRLPAPHTRTRFFTPGLLSKM